jgi:hypothetical protein
MEQFETLKGEIISEILKIADRVLLQRDVRILDASASNEFAYTDSRNIYLNYDKIRKQIKDDNEFILMTKGLNFHESAHLLFTEYNEINIRDVLNAREKAMWRIQMYHHVLNALEDGRIETFFMVRYPKSKKYFLFLFEKIIKKILFDSFGQTTLEFSKEGMLFAYIRLLTSKYLWRIEKQLIQKVEQHVINTHGKIIQEKLKELSLKYLRSNFPDRMQIAYEIMQIIYGPIPDKPPAKLRIIISIPSHGTKKNANEEAIKEFEENEDEFGDYEESKEDGKRSKGSKKEDDEDSEDVEEDENENDKKNKASKKDDTEMELEIEISNSHKQGNTAIDNESLLQDIEIIIDSNALAEELLDDNDMINDVEETMRSYHEIEQEGIMDITPNRRTNPYPFYPNDEDKRMIELIAKELRTIKNSVGFSIKANQRSGKLNIPAFIRGERTDSFNVFDRRKLSTDKNCSLGVVFCIDSSSSVNSVNHHIEQEVGYCFSKALEKVKSKVEIIEFSDYHRVMKDFTDIRGDWKRAYNGGTQIDSSLRHALNDLKVLKKFQKIKNRFIFIISDGQFETEQYLKPVIEKIHEEGIKIIYFGVGVGAILTYKNFDLSKHVKEFKDLQPEIRNIITELQKEVVVKNTGRYL